MNQLIKHPSIIYIYVVLLVIEWRYFSFHGEFNWAACQKKLMYMNIFHAFRLPSYRNDKRQKKWNMIEYSISDWNSLLLTKTKLFDYFVSILPSWTDSCVFQLFTTRKDRSSQGYFLYNDSFVILSFSWVNTVIWNVYVNNNY